MSDESKNKCTELACRILQIKEMAKELDDD
jgi:hypothetical protein